MARTSIRIEHTHSRTGKHHRISIALVISLKGGISLPDPKGLRPCRGVYVEGFAYCGEQTIPKDCVLACVYVTYGPRGRHRGYIDILNENGREVLKLKYINNRIRIISGDSRYASYAITALNNIYRVDEYGKHK